MSNSVGWFCQRLAGAAFLLVILIPRAASAGPITVSAVPSSGSVAPGSSLSVDIRIADATDLFAYQLDMTFDPLVLQATTVVDGAFLTSGGGTSLLAGSFALNFDNALGLITILDLLTGPVPPATGVSGGGTLATILFDVIAVGNPNPTALVLSGFIFEDSSLARLEVQGQDGSVRVTDGTSVVPEPGTLVLVATGALFVLRRRHPRRR
jgi:hypothetical protein